MMKWNLKYILPLFLFVISACNNKKEMGRLKNENTFIFPKGEKITNDNFAGTAYLQPLIAADSLNAIAIGNVIFKPGATVWLEAVTDEVYNK